MPGRRCWLTPRRSARTSANRIASRLSVSRDSSRRLTPGVRAAPRRRDDSSGPVEIAGTRSVTTLHSAIPCRATTPLRLGRRGAGISLPDANWADRNLYRVRSGAGNRGECRRKVPGRMMMKSFFLFRRRTSRRFPRVELPRVRGPDSILSAVVGHRYEKPRTRGTGAGVIVRGYGPERS